MCHTRGEPNDTLCSPPPPCGMDEPAAKKARGPDARGAGTAANGAGATAVAAAAADEQDLRPQYVLKYTCEGHDNSISSVKFSPDGKWLASSCASQRSNGGAQWGRDHVEMSVCLSVTLRNRFGGAVPDAGILCDRLPRRCSGGQDHPHLERAGRKVRVHPQGSLPGTDVAAAPQEAWLTAQAAGSCVLGALSQLKWRLTAGRGYRMWHGRQTPDTYVPRQMTRLSKCGTSMGYCPRAHACSVR
eukprot:COSAG01_NODE_12977_length_1654_cov_2.738907_1_plen_244_part_00